MGPAGHAAHCYEVAQHAILFIVWRYAYALEHYVFTVVLLAVIWGLGASV